VIKFVLGNICYAQWNIIKVEFRAFLDYSLTSIIVWKQWNCITQPHCLQDNVNRNLLCALQQDNITHMQYKRIWKLTFTFWRKKS